MLPQVGAQRHAVDQIVGVPGLPTLDGPVPLMVEQLVDVLQLLDALIPVAEQVIDVPKFFVERIPPRTSVREPQLAEQLVEVSTIISYSSLREIVEHNVDVPVPHGRDGGGGLLGLHPGQSSTAFSGADHRSVTAEQIVDIPAPRGGRVLHPASSSSGLPGTANQGVFRTFPQVKKSAKVASQSGSELLPESSPSTRAAQLEDPVEWVVRCCMMCKVDLQGLSDVKPTVWFRTDPSASSLKSLSRLSSVLRHEPRKR